MSRVKEDPGMSAVSEPSDPRARRARRLVVASAVVALLGVFCLEAVTSLRVKSVTTDELMYIAVGYYHLRTGDFEMNMVNPPLLKMVAAVPLLALDLDLPEVKGHPAEWNIIEQWFFSREFLYKNREDPDRILIFARMPFVFLGAVLGLYVFLWARALYGTGSGLFALGLYAFSPNILAHTRLATLDLGVTLFMFVACYYFWRHIESPSWANLLKCGAALSGAALSKTTGFFLAPIFVIVALVLVWRRSDSGGWERFPFRRRRAVASVRGRNAAFLGSTLVLLGSTAIFGLNLGYFFHGTMTPLSSDDSHEELYQRLPVNVGLTRLLTDVALETPLPVPDAFKGVLKHQTHLTATGNNVYFAGRTSTTGWWYVMPAAFLIKTPVALFFLLGIALVGMVRSRQMGTAELLMLGTAAVVFLLFAYMKNVSIGLRYILPIYPFLHVVASRAFRGSVGFSVRNAAVGGLSAWYLFASLSIYPNYLAYFNELVGGPDNGYKYLADSYLDWGQDLKQLRQFLDEKKIERVRLAYFGSGDPDYYGIRYDYLPSVGVAPQRPDQKWWFETKTAELPPLELQGPPIAVSATLLAGIFYPGYYEPLRALTPVAQIGHSILIYDPSGRLSRRDGKKP
jgi:Dolichyl-phosphate-mannose-protein mannosyltransferase